MNNFDPYAVLDVEPDADAETIKRAYRRKAQQCHPDREDGDAELFHRVQMAYELLSDPARRAAYDETGDAGKTSTDQIAFQRLAGLISQVLEATTAPFSLLAGTTPLAECRRFVKRDVIEKTEGEIAKNARAIGNLNAQRARLPKRRKKTGHNLFESVLEGKIQQLANENHQLKGELAIGKRMEELLEGYENGDMELPKGEPRKLDSPYLSAGDSWT